MNCSREEYRLCQRRHSIVCVQRCDRNESEELSLNKDELRDKRLKRRNSCVTIICSDHTKPEENEFNIPEVNIEIDKSMASLKAIEQLKSLAQAFVQRGEDVKSKIARRVSTPSVDIKSLKSNHSVLFEEQWMRNMDITRVTQLKKPAFSEFCHKMRSKELGVFEPQSAIYISWLFIVNLAFGYNAIIIFLRSIFSYENDNNRYIFFIFDYTCDAIYMIDMIWFKMRLKYVHDGQWIEDIKLTRKNYLCGKRFWFDLLALTPLDLLYIIYGFDKPILRLVRLTRLLKVQTFWEFFKRVDAIAKSPYFIRIIHTLIYKIYLIHLSTCAYYLVSLYEGFGSTQWTYDNKGNAYLRCFYFAFRTATSIGGRMPKPSNDLERVYMIISWLMGVFVFALLIGQIRDIVANATENKTQFRDILNQTVRYMRNLNLPHSLQKRVRLWLTFTWETQKTFDENHILNLLPLKLKTDLALSIHYHTLSRVQLFRDCDRNLLRDLVIKLRSILFLPGDYVCRKGDIGQEMFIVNSGHVYVMGGDDGNTILATLSEGSVFGEISILGVHGYIRRTADVRSLGYSNLFVLSKSDLWDTLTDYPENEAILRRKVRHFMKNIHFDGDIDESENIDVHRIINRRDTPSMPKLLQTVMQVIPPDSRLSQLLSRRPSMQRTHSSLSYNVNTTQLSTTELDSVLNSCQSLNRSNFCESNSDLLITNDSDNIDNEIINDIINY